MTDALINNDRHSEVIRLSQTTEGLATYTKDNTPSKTPGGESPTTGDIYNIAYDGTIRSPWALKHIGLLANYFAVGLIYGGSLSILYPILVVKQFEEPSVVKSSQALVTLFWSYKFFFGVISDCFPILGLKRKPYIMIGWVICASCLVGLASLGEDVSSNSLVIMLMLANFGYVMSAVSADGYVVWMAHREPLEKRGRTQTLIYMVREIGRAATSLLVGFGFSGPNVSCPGYEPDESTACNPALLSEKGEPPYGTGEGWCHEKCSDAAFDFDISIPTFAWILAVSNIVVIPLFVIMFEEKSTRQRFVEKMSSFWQILQKRAVWQVILYTIVSSILFGVSNNAQQNTLAAWLDLKPWQNSVLSVMENLIFFLGMAAIRQYALNFSWRKLMIYGTLLQIFFGSLYLIIVYDVWREPYFYMFTDVSGYFVSTLNFLVGVFYIVEVSEPGYEAITYSLITTSNNMIIPLSTVLSNQISGMFDLDAAAIKKDNAYVHNQYLFCWLVATIINLASLLTLPLLPGQKKQARELLAKGETSKGWAITLVIFCFVTLIYATIANLATLDKNFKCHKILGGKGCTKNESSTGAILLVTITLGFAVVSTFMVAYLPVLRKGKFNFFSYDN